MLLDDANNGKTNWASNVRDLLFDSGLNYIWYQQSEIHTIGFFDVIKNRIKDQYIQSWLSNVEKSEKLSIYKDIKLEFRFEHYLDFCYNSHLLTKLRSGTIKLNIETGRYTGMAITFM